jgi:peroxiredoxin (alkyl hydroperoxide reductase subunit C)
MATEAAETTKSLPRINEPAPDFTAQSTQGEIKLSNYKGKKWVVLFSHPADFTPVCTTEFVAFSKLWPEFEKRNVQLLGLSVDSIYSHIGWLKSIEQNFGVTVPFPLIPDRNMKIAQEYGMIHPGASDTATVRAVFVIDDKGIIRALVYYPLQAGRNMEEILRLLDALQTVDKNGVATPANWRPGDAVIVPAPVTKEGADRRKDEGYEYVDWYFSQKKL